MSFETFVCAVGASMAFGLVLAAPIVDWYVGTLGL